MNRDKEAENRRKQENKTRSGILCRMPNTIYTIYKRQGTVSRFESPRFSLALTSVFMMQSDSGELL